MKQTHLARPIHSRKGFGTLEMVIIIAVMLTVAMLFRSTLSQYASDLIDSVFKESIIAEIDNPNQP